ncbi:uncharacterized protein TNCV_3513971 [Trichonephila clavipes]|nr:uncharacterized protein TNCV_3513971 [Trichonephila clavipes]
MSRKSPFAIQKALKGIGGDPKGVNKLRSGALLIETASAFQTKSFLMAKTFLDCPLIVCPPNSLNSCLGVESEPDLLSILEAEILEGLSDLGNTLVTLKKDTAIIPTKHLILTFNSPKLPSTIKAGYLHCKIRPYIPNPLRCFKCQRVPLFKFKVICSQSHPSDSKLCPKWKTEKVIQVIKTNRNIPYVNARKLIAPHLSQSYAQVTKPSTATTTTQTDENITKIVCPPLKLLQPLISVPKPTISSSVPAVTKSSTSTQAQLLPSTSSVTVTSSSKSQSLISVIDTAPSTSNNLSTSIASSSSTFSMSTPLPACPVLEILATTTSNTIPATSQDTNQTSKLRKKKRPFKNQK